jgi:hypothetical protein
MTEPYPDLRTQAPDVHVPARDTTGRTPARVSAATRS